MTEALAQAERTSARFNEAELQRLRGEPLLGEGVPAEADAEACFHQALVIARAQEAKSLELRAATSLGRLWQRQGKGPEGLRLLADVHAWFTEGFETRDLMDARALLESERDR